MVCSVGSGRMAVMARLLEARSFTQNVEEYIGNQKLVAQYIRKEIVEADEPNLLDEEDMHMFGLKPMEDPLQLIYCHACKKPIKASHFAAHADLCRFLSSTRDAKADLDYCTERRKPPRRKQKGQLVSVSANLYQFLVDRKQETGSPMDAHDSITTETHDNGELSSFFSVAEAGNYTRCTLSQSQYIDHNSADDTCHRDLHDNHVQNQNVPAPLATKIYYSQRNNRLRSEIGYMFQAADAQELDYDVTAHATQQNITQPKFSSQSSSPLGQAYRLVLQNSDARLMVEGLMNFAGGSSSQSSIDGAVRQEALSTIPQGSTQENVQRTDGDAPCTDIFGQRYY
ncbi:PREDICTED: uncharacterized protein LOC104820236 isoform X2 [Tarenaya hassleriana]|uniref:uncharacterized protein LOC104820236 isoform X2 n=1 Tax=Tarenaya hassleriana TaxID=28532 RepID=UPI00053C8F84|nr:PREDICTED: uncharacterized protein LOC104820236 isoform X2 [Tarenaya hassleriana]